MPSDKPINVEAQRVAKIIDDTERKFKSFVHSLSERLSVLSLLSHELFAEVKKKDLDQLSKFNSHSAKDL